MNAVKSSKEFELLFQIAQSYVNEYFSKKVEDSSSARTEMSGERSILVKAVSMSVDFFSTIKKLYKDRGEEQAIRVAQQFLFDIAHAIGKEDAKKFHKRMHLKKSSAGATHFASSEWASVDILPESEPVSDENYYLIYNHLYSFESDAWLKAKKTTSFPVCIMNAGYSSGWCEESFGIPLVASEILCKAKGDSCCRFIMAPPSKIEERIQAYKKSRPRLAKKIVRYETPQFFERKFLEEALRKSEERYRRQFEESMDAMLLIDAKKGIFLDSNPAAGRLLNRERSELIGQSVRILNPKVKFIEKVNHSKKTQVSMLQDAEIVTKEGEIKYVSIQSSTFELNGELVISAVLRDVTVRKKAEDALNQSLQFEKTLGKIAKEFSQLPIDEVRTGIQQSLAEIGSILDFDRAHCVLFSQKDMAFPSQFDWHSKNLGTSKYATQYYFSELFPKFYEELSSKEVVWIQNIARLPCAWKSEKKIWKNQKIKSIVCLPLMSQQAERVGFVCYESLLKRQELDKQDVSLLNAYNEILVAALGRHVTKRKLERLAKFDSLSGLPNRLQFEESANKSIAYSSRRHKKFAVLSIDLDKFKEVNDSYGHHVGDLLIQAVAARLQSKIRMEDTVARLGGDEFVALIMDLKSKESAISVAKWLIQSNQGKYDIHGHPIKMTMSIGIACYPDDGEDLETLLSHADEAMYQAKHKGRDAYHFFTSGALPESNNSKPHQMETR